MAMSSLTSLLLFFSLSISLRPLAVAGDTLQDACAKTAYANLCVSSLMTKPESKTADLHGLAELSVRVAAEVGTTAGNFARDKLNGVNDTGLWQCLDDCADSIEQAIEHLDDSTGVLDEAKFNEVKTWLSAALSDTSSCEGSCKDVPASEIKDAVVAKNAEFEKLLNVTLALVSSASTVGAASPPSP